MKKIFLVLICVTMTLMLAGCGGEEKKQQSYYRPPTYRWNDTPKFKFPSDDDGTPKFKFPGDDIVNEKISAMKKAAKNAKASAEAARDAADVAITAETEREFNEKMKESYGKIENATNECESGRSIYNNSFFLRTFFGGVIKEIDAAREALNAAIDYVNKTTQYVKDKFRIKEEEMKKNEQIKKEKNEQIKKEKEAEKKREDKEKLKEAVKKEQAQPSETKVPEQGQRIQSSEEQTHKIKICKYVNEKLSCYGGQKADMLELTKRNNKLYIILDDSNSKPITIKEITFEDKEVAEKIVPLTIQMHEDEEQVDSYKLPYVLADENYFPFVVYVNEYISSKVLYVKYITSDNEEKVKDINITLSSSVEKQIENKNLIDNILKKTVSDNFGILGVSSEKLYWDNNRCNSIKNKYKKLSKACHPDKNPEYVNKATEASILINSAYENLRVAYKCSNSSSGQSSNSDQSSDSGQQEDDKQQESGEQEVDESENQDG